MKMTDEEIIRYILELTGYNEIISVVNETLESDKLESDKVVE
jgi:hypothetical protein